METTSLRRAFTLLPEDAEHLDARGLVYETIIEGDFRWLLIRQFPIPPGYNVSEANIAISFPASYPTTQLDMVYVFPSLRLTSGKAIGATDVPQQIDNQTYQRWSRHRTEANPWRPNLDDLSTHMGLIEEWFLKETKK